MDAESGLNAPEIEEYLTSHRILLVTAPEGLGWLIFPCDHSSHSVMKRNYYRELGVLKKNMEIGQILTPYTKFNAWRSAFWSLLPSTAAGFFEDLGLVAGSQGFRPVHEVSSHLFSEGLRRMEKHLDLHREQLLRYLNWRKEHNLGFKLIQKNHHFLEGSLYWDILKDFIDTN